jgi:hypothetical protein
MVKKIKPKRKRVKVTKNIKTKTHDLLDTLNEENKFLKKYPGFTIAIAFAIILLILFVALSLTGTASGEELAQARTMHEENSLYLEELTLNFENYERDFTEPLDDDYYFSIKDDLDWLKEKENLIYHSFPGNEIYLKEMAFTIFMEKIVQTNLDFTFEFFEQDYEQVINEALEKEITKENFVDSEEIELFFEEMDHEQLVFETTLDQLTEEYFVWKKNILLSDSGNERKFVEAKKLIFLSYE